MSSGAIDQKAFPLTLIHDSTCIFHDKLACINTDKLFVELYKSPQTRCEDMSLKYRNMKSSLNSS